MPMTRDEWKKGLRVKIADSVVYPHRQTRRDTGTIVGGRSGYYYEWSLFRVLVDGNKSPTTLHCSRLTPLENQNAEEDVDLLQRGREQEQSGDNPPVQSESDAHLLGLVGEGRKADEAVQGDNHPEEDQVQGSWFA